jgi:hypothetical protein
MAKNLPEQHNDASARLKASPGDDHIHPINLRVHPGTGKRSDFDPGGPEVPARAARERVDPGTANDARRTPLIDVTAITPAGSGNHGAVPPPRKL